MSQFTQDEHNWSVGSFWPAPGILPEGPVWAILLSFIVYLTNHPVIHHPFCTEGLWQARMKSSKALAIQSPFSLAKDLVEPQGFCLHCASCLSLPHSRDASSCHLEGSLWLTLALQLFYFQDYGSRSQALTAALQLPCRTLSFVIDLKTLDPSFPRAPLTSHVFLSAHCCCQMGNHVLPHNSSCSWLWPYQKRYLREMVGYSWNWRMEKIQAGWRKGQGREGGKAGMESGMLGAEQAWLV